MLLVLILNENPTHSYKGVDLDFYSKFTKIIWQWSKISENQWLWKDNIQIVCR
jgi:hypothetical protein